jgi:hypothetical protein
MLRCRRAAHMQVHVSRQSKIRQRMIKEAECRSAKLNALRFVHASPTSTMRRMHANCPAHKSPSRDMPSYAAEQWSSATRHSCDQAAHRGTGFQLYKLTTYQARSSLQPASITNGLPLLLTLARQFTLDRCPSPISRVCALLPSVFSTRRP